MDQKRINQIREVLEYNPEIVWYREVVRELLEENESLTWRLQHRNSMIVGLTRRLIAEKAPLPRWINDWAYDLMTQVSQFPTEWKS